VVKELARLKRFGPFSPFEATVNLSWYVTILQKHLFMFIFTQKRITAAGCFFQAIMFYLYQMYNYSSVVLPVHMHTDADSECGRFWLVHSCTNILHLNFVFIHSMKF
jgi:hypothetical protein